jgi:hypothetical protein
LDINTCASNEGVGQSALDRPRRRRQLDDLGAIAAGQLGANVPQRPKVTWHPVELLGDVLAQATHAATACRTRAVARLVHDGLARQVIGQHPTGYLAAWVCRAALATSRRRRLLRAVLRRNRIFRGFLGRSGKFLLGQYQVQLRQRGIGLLGGTAKTPAAQPCDLGLELLDQLTATEGNTLERFYVVGELFALLHHARIVEKSLSVVNHRERKYLRGVLWLRRSHRPSPVDAFEQH